MVKLKSKIQVLFVFALLLQLIIIPLNSFAAKARVPVSANSIDYLALGDSLAAGVTPNNELGKSYADFLTGSLQSVDALKSYNKGFSYPGYTTTNVLQDIQNNVTKEVYGVGYLEKTAKLQESIKSAEIITISAGANDTLAYLKIDPITGAATIDQAGVSAAIQQVAVNYMAIMNQIKILNPDVKIYVMGYYNPYPQLAAELQPQLNQLLGLLNQSINYALTGTGAVFVPTSDVVAANYLEYLPNPANIHMSEAGYKKVAELFWNQIGVSYEWPKGINLTELIKQWEASFTFKPIIKEEVYMPTKTWTVKLSSEIDPSTIQEALYVIDAEGNLIPTTFTSDGKNIFIAPPMDHYKEGIYTLYILPSLKNKQGVHLKEPIKMNFTIK